jgi:hypothetical protein
MYRMLPGDSCTSHQLPLPAGVYYGQYDRLDQMNDRLYDRNVPLETLSPNMDARSIPTRNTVYPVQDRRSKYKHASNLDRFRPDVESQLRNQFFALQHGAPQGVYIPDTNSDLYGVRIPVTENPIQQPFPNLFHVPRMTTAPPPMMDRIGAGTFQNNTRTQLRGLS